MKKFKDISEFEDLLRDNLQGHSTPAPPDVWSSVASSTAQSASVLSQATAFLSSTTNILKVALFAGGIAAAGIVIYNENSTPNDATTAEIIVENGPKAITIDNLDSNRTTSAETKSIKSTSDKENTEIISDSKNSLNIKNNTPKNENTSEVKSEGKPIVKDSRSEPNTPKQTTVPSNSAGVDLKETLSIQASSTQSCLGDVVTFTSNIPVIWSADKTNLTAQPSTTAKYTCQKIGDIKIRGGDKTILLRVGDTKSSITVNEENDNQNYTAKLSNKDQLANWYINDKIVATNTSSITHKINQVGTHIIKAKIINQPCASDAEYVVSISPIGKIKTWDIFTPNGDGKNDSYTVDISGYENYSIQIVDAQNRLLFFSTDPENGWNGRVENVGNECASGYYVAKISYTLKGEKPDTKNVRFRLQRS